MLSRRKKGAVSILSLSTPQRPHKEKEVLAKEVKGRGGILQQGFEEEGHWE